MNPKCTTKQQDWLTHLLNRNGRTVSSEAYDAFLNLTTAQASAIIRLINDKEVEKAIGFLKTHNIQV